LSFLLQEHTLHEDTNLYSAWFTTEPLFFKNVWVHSHTQQVSICGMNEQT
jgi:hypothetical protein